MLSLVISLTALQYALIFPAIIVLRRKDPGGTGLPATGRRPGHVALRHRHRVHRGAHQHLAALARPSRQHVRPQLQRPRRRLEHWSRLFLSSGDAGVTGRRHHPVARLLVGRQADLARGVVGEGDLLGDARRGDAGRPGRATAAEPLGVVNERLRRRAAAPARRRVAGGRVFSSLNSFFNQICLQSVLRLVL